MKRVGIAVYVDNNENILQEFQWLRKSWLYSGSWQVSDLVAFYNPTITNFPDALGDVICIPLKPHTELNLSWKDYPFINSIEYLTRPEASILSNYQYILRTDCDTFLTPSFLHLKPRLALFGIGMYASEPIVAAKLAQISAKWGYQSIFNNVGSTFIAPTESALLYSQIQMEFCKRLRAEEFPDGFGEWPKWYQGVLTMYAGQLAASAVFGYNMTLGGLDVHCMSDDGISSTDYHIHAWHTHDYFSKFKWREGAYKDIDRTQLNPNKINDYCLFIAGGSPA